MKIDDRLKKIIFKKLAKDLSHVEVIPFEGDIWFIDRDNKFWYFELKKDGHLWWRLDFFDNFFRIFLLGHNDYKSLIKEWVEQVLNNKVNRTTGWNSKKNYEMEQVLNNKVNTAIGRNHPAHFLVQQVLNHKVNTDH